MREERLEKIVSCPKLDCQEGKTWELSLNLLTPKSTQCDTVNLTYQSPFLMQLWILQLEEFLKFQ